MRRPYYQLHTPEGITFANLFWHQQENQNAMLKSDMYDGFKSEGTKITPTDDPKLMSYHIQQLVSEIGEVLSSDNRWKNFRNRKFDKDNKLEEIADCFIVMMNIAMYSGFNASDVVEAITAKLNKVTERVNAVNVSMESGD